MSSACLSKCQQVKKRLARTIKEGRLAPGERVATEAELSRRYKVGRSTIREAISALVHEGYMYRVQGSGTFVTAARQPQAGRFALLINTDDHVYRRQSQVVLEHLQEHHALSYVVSTGGTPEAAAAATEAALSESPDGLLVDTDRSCVLDVLKRQSGNIDNLVFMNTLRMPSESGVVHDLAAGIGQATRHLLELGRTPALLVPEAARPMSLMLSQVHRGYQAALAEYGLESKAQYIKQRRFAPDVNEVREVLAGPNRPDGIITMGDYRAKYVFQAAAELGLRIPDDIAIVGYYDTPWAELFPVPLTSMSIESETIARTAADMLLRHVKNPALERVTIKPRLVVRGSCGATKPPGSHER